MWLYYLIFKILVVFENFFLFKLYLFNIIFVVCNIESVFGSVYLIFYIDGRYIVFIIKNEFIILKYFILFVMFNGLSKL